MILPGGYVCVVKTERRDIKSIALIRQHVVPSLCTGSQAQAGCHAAPLLVAPMYAPAYSNGSILYVLETLLAAPAAWGMGPSSGLAALAEGWAKPAKATEGGPKWLGRGRQSIV